MRDYLKSVNATYCGWLIGIYAVSQKTSQTFSTVTWRSIIGWYNFS